MQLGRGLEDNSNVLFHNNEGGCSSFHFIILKKYLFMLYIVFCIYVLERTLKK